MSPKQDSLNNGPCTSLSPRALPPRSAMPRIARDGMGYVMICGFMPSTDLTMSISSRKICSEFCNHSSDGKVVVVWNKCLLQISNFSNDIGLKRQMTSYLTGGAVAEILLGPERLPKLANRCDAATVGMRLIDSNTGRLSTG